MSKMRVVGKLVMAYQYYDGMSKEYKEDERPHTIVVGIVVRRSDRLGHSFLEVRDGAGRFHMFSGNFNFTFLDTLERVYGAMKEVKVRGDEEE